MSLLSWYYELHVPIPYYIFWNYFLTFFLGTVIEEFSITLDDVKDIFR